MISDYERKACDCLLKVFAEATDGFIETEALRKDGSMLAEQNEVLAFLVAEGLLEKSGRGYKITYKGRIVVADGGLHGRSSRDEWALWLALIAAVTGVFSVLLQLLM